MIVNDVSLVGFSPSPESNLVFGPCEGLLMATPFPNVVTCSSVIDRCGDRWETAMHVATGLMCRVGIAVVGPLKGSVSVSSKVGNPPKNGGL